MYMNLSEDVDLEECILRFILPYGSISTTATYKAFCPVVSCAKLD